MVGIDVVPPSQKEGWSLSTKSDNSNFQFQYGDILQPPLAFPDHHFDFVYQRDVASLLPVTAWSHLMAEFFRVIKPGGQIQLVEYGNATPYNLLLRLMIGSLYRYAL